jgi:cation/acetate symporter
MKTTQNDEMPDFKSTCGNARADHVGSGWLGVWLTALLFFPVGGFFAFAAFSPRSLAFALIPGQPITGWYAYGLGLIFYSVVLGFLYVIITNRAADRIADEEGANWAKRAARLGALLLGVIALGGALGGLTATGANAASANPEPSGMNYTAVAMFLALLAGTLGITWWAARRTRTTKEFYSAGGNMTALQNGLATAGDTISAGAFLGLAGLVYGNGFDGLLYAAGYSVGYPVITMLFADRMRNLGKFTFADILANRLAKTPMRLFAAFSTLTIVIFFLVAQMVGAGQLIELLFGLDYVYAELAVGLLMVIYVMFGGMMATTWVQIIKAVLMLFSGVTISLLALSAFGFDYGALVAHAVALHPKHEAMLVPTSFAAAPYSTMSLFLAMFFGSAGFPHLIMRLFTVPDARTARNSMMWASVFIGAFFALISIVGPSAVALVMGNPDYVTATGALRGGGNMAAVHLAHAVGGNVMLGFVSAVAFATILAVVAGLTLAGASAVSHDLYANIIRKGTVDERSEVRVSRFATLGLGLLAVVLGVAFRTQNIAYLISLVVGIAASSNFVLLVLAIYWRGLTTRGAVIGGGVGLVSSIVLTVLGPAVWVKTLGFAAPVFALDPPTLVTLPLAFAVCIGVSLLDRSRQAARDRAQYDALNQVPSGAMIMAAE